MPIEMRVRVQEDPRLTQALRAVRMPGARRAIGRALRASAYLVQESAKDESIIRGGARATGGALTGSYRQSKPHPTKLTSRTGHGRRSIRINMLASGMAIEVGSDVGYMALHEEGGIAARGGAHARAHFAKYPPRPWLKPALDKVSPKFPNIFVEELLREIS